LIPQRPWEYFPAGERPDRGRGNLAGVGETGVDLEFHQLDCRYESLRVRQPERERRLLASLADHGQQTSIVVVRRAGAYVVVDGHKRCPA
jgi:hypothetical protein